MATARAISFSWDPAVSHRPSKDVRVGGLIIDGTKWRGESYRYLTADPRLAGIDFSATGDVSFYDAIAYGFYFTNQAAVWERGDETNQVAQLNQNCGWLDVDGPVWLDVDCLNSVGQIVRGGLVSEVSLAWTMSFYPHYNEQTGKSELPFSKSYSASRKVLGLIPCQTPPVGALCVSGFPNASTYQSADIDTDSSDLDGIYQTWNFSQTMISSSSFRACYNANPRYDNNVPSPSWPDRNGVGLYALNLSATNIRIIGHQDVFTTIPPITVLSSAMNVGMVYRA